MAAAFVLAALGDGTSTTPSAALGVAPVENELLVAFVACGVSTLSAGINGYTKRTEAVPPAGRRGCFYDKIAGAAEPAAQAPCTLGSSVVWACHILRYSGINTSTWLDVENSVADNDTTKTSPTVDPSDNVDVLVVGAAFANSGSGTFSGQTVNGSATGVTERTDVGVSRASSVWDWIGNVSTSTFVTVATSSSNSEGGAHLAIYRSSSPFARSLVGAQPTATGALSRAKAALRSLTGSQPTATGALDRLRIVFRALAGAQPSAAGVADWVHTFLRTLTGDQPSASGVASTVNTTTTPPAPGVSVQTGGGREAPRTQTSGRS